MGKYQDPIANSKTVRVWETGGGYTMKNRKMRISVLINALWLTTLIFQPVTLAKGRVEHHLMISRILADAGQPGDRELSVYLPEEYDTLGLDYPLL